ncbi:MAG: transposase [Oscillospiraceae bacterium]|nr:transposase [Oscillospiraceae bacterium]
MGYSLDLELILRLHLLQNLYDLSDMATAEQCIDNPRLRRFGSKESCSAAPNCVQTGCCTARRRSRFGRAGLHARRSPRCPRPA